MVATIYVLRHGDRLGWNTDKWDNLTGTPQDDPLSPKGVQQSDEVARYFSNLPSDERPTAIFSSPLYRCLQTVTPTAVALGVPIYVEQGLGEWLTPLPEGELHKMPGAGEELRKYFPEIRSWTSALVPPQKGEDLAQLHERMGSLASALNGRVGMQVHLRDSGINYEEAVVQEMMDALSGVEKVTEDIDKDKHNCILVVGHVAPLIALIRMLVGDRELPLRLGCASISILQRRMDKEHLGEVKLSDQIPHVGRYEPVKLNSSKHLADGDWIPWGFMDL